MSSQAIFFLLFIFMTSSVAESSNTSGEEIQFETDDTGAYKTVLKGAKTIRNYIVINHRIYKAIDTYTLKPGRYGAAKIHFVMTDIVNGETLTYTAGTNDNIHVPIVKFDIPRKIRVKKLFAAEK